MMRPFLLSAGMMLAMGCLLPMRTEAQKDAKPALPDVKGVNNLAYSPDGSFLLVEYRSSGGRPDATNAQVGVWDAKTGQFRLEMEKPPQRVERLAVSPDGKTAAAISIGGKQLKLWDAATGKIAEEFTLPTWKGSIQSAPFLVFSGDGTKLYTIWDKQILEVKRGGKPRLLTPNLGLWTIDSIAASTDAKTLTVARNVQGKKASDLKIYDLTRDGEAQTAALSDHVRGMAISNDGKTLAISYLRGLGPKAKPRFELWDTSPPKLRTTLSLTATPEFQNFQRMVFSPDDKLIAANPLFSAASDKPIQVLNLEGKVVQEATSKFTVLQLSFSPDGKKLAAILGNNTLLFTDLEAK